MRTISSILILSLALAACGDDSPDTESGLDGSLHLPDASSLLDANLSDANGNDASTKDASTFLPPAVPSAFKLSLHDTMCLGSCPEFTVSLDQTGEVAFKGGYCAARPGAFHKQVSAADAKAVYDAFVQAGFWSFGDRYEQESDGCGSVHTDGSTSLWTAEVDGHAKMIARYNGCVEAPFLAPLDGLAAVLRSHSGTDAWVEGDSASACRLNSTPKSDKLASSYSLAQRGQLSGLLELSDHGSAWQLLDCARNKTAAGTVDDEEGRLVLRAAANGSIALPLSLGNVASIVIESDDQGVLRAHALRADDEVDFVLTAAAGC